jgi:protein-tyrosine phosphatase
LIYVVYGLGVLIALPGIAWCVYRIAVRLGGRKVHPVDSNAWIIPPPQEVEVLHDSDGTLEVCWKAKADRVSIYHLDDPDDPDSAALVVKVTGEAKIKLPGPQTRKRPYFRIEFSGGEKDGQALVVAERTLKLESVNNLRDIGGYQTCDGHRVKWGRVYRAGNLSRINDPDLQYLAGLGINLVCDLRATAEMKDSPDRLPPGCGYLHLPVYEDEFFRAITKVLLFRRHELGDALGRGYLNWLETGAQAYGQLIERLADPASLPVIIHCTAGKDRAGIGIAILLSLLGVPEETIVADYSLTNQAFERLYQEFVEADLLSRLGIPNEELQIMLAANPDWIKRTLDLIHTRYVDAATYLHQVAGLSQPKIQAIRHNLLES